MKTRSIFLAITGTFVFTIILFSLLNKEFKLFQSDSDSQIIIGINEWPGYSPVIYAKILGLYEKYHLDVKVILYPGQYESNLAFERESTNAFGAVLPDLIPLNSNKVKARPVIICDYSNNGDVLISNRNIKSIKELKGKTIGIDSLNSFSHMFVLEVLKNHGLKESDVNFKIIPYQEVDRSIENKIIDAGHTWNPAKTAAIKNGKKIIATGNDIPGFIIDSIAFSERYIELYPKKIELFKRAFYEAQTEMINNPTLASEKMKAFYHNNSEEYAKSFSDLHFITKDEFQNLINYTFESKIKYYNDFYVERGQVSDPNIYRSIMPRWILE